MKQDLGRSPVFPTQARIEAILHRLLAYCVQVTFQRRCTLARDDRTQVLEKFADVQMIVSICRHRRSECGDTYTNDRKSRF